jgi:hypothetical protein
VARGRISVILPEHFNKIEDHFRKNNHANLSAFGCYDFVQNVSQAVDNAKKSGQRVNANQICDNFLVDSQLQTLLSLSIARQETEKNNIKKSIDTYPWIKSFVSSVVANFIFLALCYIIFIAMLAPSSPEDIKEVVDSAKAGNTKE